MSETRHPFLDLSRMEVLRRVRLRPRGATEGSLAGPHRSHYRGTAVEFADYREYVDGDDLRLLDWKVFARSDRYFVRLYEAERSLLCYLVVDKSGSMEFAGEALRTPSKLEHACRLAAALAYLVVREGDEAGLSLADERLGEHLPPRAGWPHLGALLHGLARAQAAGKTDLGACLNQVFARVVRRGILAILSDFLDPSPQVWTAVELFRRSMFDVMLFHVVHPEEMELPEVPMARFADTEGGATRFQTEPDVVRDAYRQRFAAFVRQVEGHCRARGCDWFLARTDADPYEFLQRCFLERGAVR